MLRDIFMKIASYLYLTAQANVTDELEERIEILEDTVLVIEQDVEELENEDALINVRLFDIEMDVFDNENAIEGMYLSPWILLSLSVPVLRRQFFS